MDSSSLLRRVRESQFGQGSVESGFEPRSGRQYLRKLRNISLNADNKTEQPQVNALLIKQLKTHVGGGGGGKGLFNCSALKRSL